MHEIPRIRPNSFYTWLQSYSYTRIGQLVERSRDSVAKQHFATLCRGVSPPSPLLNRGCRKLSLVIKVETWRWIKGHLIRGSIMKIRRAGREREATNDEPFEKQSTIKGVEPFGYSYLELERQIPRDFCPGKLHKFSRATSSTLFPYFHPLFPPIVGEV